MRRPSLFQRRVKPKIETESLLEAFIKVRSTTIKCHEADWSRLEEDVQLRINEALDKPGYWYFNPAFSLHAPSTSSLKRFLRQVHGKQVQWNQMATRRMGVCSWRRTVLAMPESLRLLLSCGYLIINGTMFWPKKWPDA